MIEFVAAAIHNWVRMAATLVLQFTVASGCVIVLVLICDMMLFLYHFVQSFMVIVSVFNAV